MDYFFKLLIAFALVGINNLCAKAGNKDAINTGVAFYLLNQNRLVVNPQETHFAAAGFMNDHLVFYGKRKKFFLLYSEI